MKIVLTTMPPSTNHIYQRGMRSVHLKPEVREARDDVGWEAKSQYSGYPLDGSLAVTIDLFWPDKRKHDIDNGLKFLLDSLSDILWYDDGQIEELHVKKHFDKASPRVEITVEATP